MTKTRTQIVIYKYCENIDRLIYYWRDEKDYFNLLIKISRKADFLAGMLGLGDYYSTGKLRWDEHQKEIEKEALQKWKESLNRRREDQLTKPKTRIELLNARKQQAKQIKEPIPEIESGTRCKSEKTKERLESLLTTLKEIQEIQNLDAAPTELDRPGRKANRLIVEMGLYSKWWRLARQTQLISETKLPYDEFKDNQSGYKSLTDVITGDNDPEHSKTEKDKVNYWIERVDVLLNKVKEKESPALHFNKNNQEKKPTLDDLEDPISCSELSGIVREKSHNIAAKLRRHDYPVYKIARRNYCEIRHAAILWWKKRQAIKKSSKKLEE